MVDNFGNISVLAKSFPASQASIANRLGITDDELRQLDGGWAEIPAADLANAAARIGGGCTPDAVAKAVQYAMNSNKEALFHQVACERELQQCRADRFNEVLSRYYPDRRLRDQMRWENLQLVFKPFEVRVRPMTTPAFDFSSKRSGITVPKRPSATCAVTYRHNDSSGISEFRLIPFGADDGSVHKDETGWVWFEQGTAEFARLTQAWQSRARVAVIWPQAAAEM